MAAAADRYLAATAHDSVWLSSDRGSACVEVISPGELLPLCEPMFAVSGLWPRIASFEAPGRRLLVTVQKDAPENLGYGVFEVRVDSQGKREAVCELPGNQPLPRSSRRKTALDPTSGLRWLLMATWGNGSWRLPLDNLRRFPPGTGNTDRQSLKTGPFFSEGSR